MSNTLNHITPSLDAKALDEERKDEIEEGYFILPHMDANRAEAVIAACVRKSETTDDPTFRRHVVIEECRSMIAIPVYSNNPIEFGVVAPIAFANCQPHVGMQAMADISDLVLSLGRDNPKMVESIKGSIDEGHRRLSVGADYMRVYFERGLSRLVSFEKIGAYRLEQVSPLVFILSFDTSRFHRLNSVTDLVIDFTTFPDGVFVDVPSGRRYDLFTYNTKRIKEQHSHE